MTDDLGDNPTFKELERLLRSMSVREQKRFADWLNEQIEAENGQTESHNHDGDDSSGNSG